MSGRLGAVSRPRRRTLRGDAGAGGVLAVAIVGASVAVALAVLASAAVLVVHQRLAAAADAGALAAADALLGVVPGDPCALAAEVATAHRVALSGCALEGAEARVAVRQEVLGIPVAVSARAGPPP